MDLHKACMDIHTLHPILAEPGGNALELVSTALAKTQRDILQLVGTHLQEPGVDIPELVDTSL
jgi:hypothetical protein